MWFERHIKCIHIIIMKFPRFVFVSNKVCSFKILMKIIIGKSSVQESNKGIGKARIGESHW